MLQFFALPADSRGFGLLLVHHVHHVRVMADQPSGTEKKSTSTLLLLTVAVVIGLAGGGGVMWFLSHKAAAQAAEPGARPDEGAARGTSEVKAVLHLDSFVVNLADTEQPAFLRIEVNVGLSKPLSTEKTQKDSPVTPLVRDTVLAVLTSWRSDQLLAPDGKAKLKTALVKAIQERVPDLGVKDIYFNDFLVQR